MTNKHRGGNVMMWNCMPWRGVGPIYHIEGIMDWYQYIHILSLVHDADENWPITCKHVYDKDPKRTTRSVKDSAKANSISVISWPACSPDLSPVESLRYAGEHYYSTELAWCSALP
ncbi:hypothetical protein Trydic_g2182 [Trypoxylus dichotomus]